MTGTDLKRCSVVSNLAAAEGDCVVKIGRLVAEARTEDLRS